MARETNLEAIRAACIKANRDIEHRLITRATNRITVAIPDDTIRLADVLKATTRKYGYPLELYEGQMVGDAEQQVLALLSRYNLVTDDLTQQSDECIQFLADLLANDNST